MSQPDKQTLTEIIPGVYVIPGVTNVGVITDTNNSITDIYLVDTGRTEEQGLSVLNAITDFFNNKNQKFQIKAIFNTHAHSDHCGADSVIQKQYNCPIYLSAYERGILDNPYLQGSILWGGFTPHELQNSLYKPAEVKDTRLIDFTKKIDFHSPDSSGSSDFSVSFLELPGHYYGDTGILITAKNGDNILFSGDAISNREELGKYWIQFMVQPEKFMQTLDKICKIPNLKCCIPSHGKIIYDDLNETAELCKIAVISTRQSILNSLKHKKLTTEQVIQEAAKQNNISMGLGQYYLVSATIKSHLACLHDQKIIKMKVIENQVVWEY